RGLDFDLNGGALRRELDRRGANGGYRFLADARWGVVGHGGLCGPAECSRASKRPGNARIGGVICDGGVNYRRAALGNDRIRGRQRDLVEVRGRTITAVAASGVDAGGK